MNFKSKYFWFLVLTIVGYALFEYYRPEPIDWNPTYTNKDKIPFGTKATFELLKDVFKDQRVESLRLPVYNHLLENKLPPRSNYIFVCHDFVISGADRTQLLNYVSKGNVVFVSAYNFSDSLSKILGIKARLKAPALRDTALTMNFVNPNLKTTKGYVFKHDDGRNYFEITKPEKVVILAQNARNEPIFVKINYGKGSFYLHNIPLALTNYYVLDNNMLDFAFKSLSYLPVQQVYWDEYLKQGRFDKDQDSVLRFIMTQPPLKWGYYLAIFGLLFYAIFAGKRTQRIIPIMNPPKNTSLEFVETIGEMYYQKGDHANIARKRIQYFLAFIRSKYGLRTNAIDADFKTTLAAKTAIDKDEIEALFTEINRAESNPYLSQFGLVELNAKIENFLEKI
jgi:hypothetical protein